MKGGKYRRATEKLTELAELIHAVDPKGRAPDEWIVLTMVQRKAVVRLLMLIANDVDPRDEFFKSIAHSPGQPELHDRKFFAELDYRLKKEAGESDRGLRERVRKSWKLSSEQMRRAALQFKGECELMMKENTNRAGLRVVVELRRGTSSATTRKTSRTT